MVSTFIRFSLNPNVSNSFFVLNLDQRGSLCAQKGC